MELRPDVWGRVHEIAFSITAMEAEVGIEPAHTALQAVDTPTYL